MKSVDRLLRIAFVLLTACVAEPAMAVMASVDGRGQVLIYPYYTARTSPLSGSAQNTLISIFNNTAAGKAIKLRFREAKTGAIVLEANVFLSVADVWTGAVVPNGDGAALVSRDGSCTIPVLRAAADGSIPSAAVFSSAAYQADGIDASADRVREGFVEVLEMGSIQSVTSTLGRPITHINGVASCDLPTETAMPALLDPPTGGLQGSAVVINVLEGTAYNYEAVALDAWRDSVLYAVAGSGTPTLADAAPPVTTVVAEGRAYIHQWSSGIDAVNAALLAQYTFTQFMREAAVNGATDIAYTFPTRPLAVTAQSARAPFYATLTSEGACEYTDPATYSRDEQVDFLLNGTPRPPQVGALCWATTVQALTSHWPAPTDVVGSQTGFRYFVLTGVRQSLDVQPTRFEAGIAVMSFQSAQSMQPSSTIVVDLRTGATSTPAPLPLRGLPVVGVSFVRYVNGTIPTDGAVVLANYGTSSPLFVRRPPPAP